MRLRRWVPRSRTPSARCRLKPERAQGGGPLASAVAESYQQMDPARLIAALAAALAVAAAVADVRQRRIPNRLTYPMMLAGLLAPTGVFGLGGPVVWFWGGAFFWGAFFFFFLL